MTADTEWELDLIATQLGLQLGFPSYAIAVAPAQRAAVLILGARPAAETAHCPTAGLDDQIDLFEARKEGTR